MRVLSTKGKINAYTCKNLHNTITINTDEGVTPMFINCPKCAANATSRMYDVAQNFQPTHEWYKPSEEEMIQEAKQISTVNKIPFQRVYKSFEDHVKQGGLLLRKRS